MDRRREALGRNRQGPETRNLVPAFVLIAALLAAAGWYAHDYFTTPERVFGARLLDCPPTEITWTEESARTSVITGCGKKIRAVCPPEEPCREDSRL